MNTITGSEHYVESQELLRKQQFDIVEAFEVIGAGIIHTLELSGTQSDQLEPFAPIIEHPFASAMEGLTYDLRGRLNVPSEQQLADVHHAAQMKEGETLKDAYGRVFWLGVRNHFRHRNSQSDNYLVAGGPYSAPEGDGMKNKLKDVLSGSTIETPAVNIDDYNQAVRNHIDYLASVARVQKIAGAQIMEQAGKAA